MSDQDKAAFGRYTTGRKYQAAKKRAEEADVNLLKDPKTYAVVSGLLGTAPDELGFSVLHPEYEAIQRVAEPAFGVGTLLGVAPALAPLTKGLPVGASIKSVTSPQKASRGLYSKVDEVAGLLTREKGTGAEFLKEIQKTKGVSPKEIEDRKLDKVLPAMGKTTKAEVKKVLEQNPPPRLQEEVLGGRDDWRIRLDLLENRGVRNLNPAEREEYYRLMDRRMEEGALKEESPAKYQDYTIPGGENYREILLKLPSNRPSIKDMDRQQYNLAVQRADEAGIRDYQSRHWESPNVLAHARVSDRTGPNGEKILHVEEIQSDWHQEARKKGYISPELRQQAQEIAERRKLAQEAVKEAERKVNFAKGYVQQYDQQINDPKFATLPAEYQESIKTLRDRLTNSWMNELPVLMKARSELDAIPDPQKMLGEALPDAPFKKNWHELTMKRLLNYAAENGYDRIAITPGAKQAERYDLSKQVNRVVWNEETGEFAAQRADYAGPRDDRPPIRHSGVTKEKLADIIGKEPAERLLSAQDMGGWRSIEGDDLRIGGEGMRGFYDKILPDYLNNYGKQYGAQVSEMRIPNPPKDSSSVIGYPFGEEYMQGRITWSEFLEKNPNAVQDFYVPLHSFDITPQMRQDITQKGLPLYQQVGIPTGIGATQIEQPAEQPMEEPPFKRGGKVRFSTNPDTIRLELMSKR